MSICMSVSSLDKCFESRKTNDELKMGDDVKIFEVDQARYITFGAVKQALDPEVTKRIKQISSIAANKSNADTSNASKKISFKLAKNDVFMVIIYIASAIEFPFYTCLF